MLHLTAADVGDWAACVAAVAAMVGLYFARQTVREAKAARVDAEAARRDAVAERREAERDRLRHRLQRIGELVDSIRELAGNDIYRQSLRGGLVPAHVPNTPTWTGARNLLRHALVGLTAQLPNCMAIVNAGTAELAHAAVPEARDEVERALQRVDEED